MTWYPQIRKKWAGDRLGEVGRARSRGGAERVCVDGSFCFDGFKMSMSCCDLPVTKSKSRQSSKSASFAKRRLLQVTCN